MKCNSSIKFVAALVAIGGSTFAFGDTDTAPEMQFSMSVGGSVANWTDSSGLSAGGPYWSYNSSYQSPGGALSYQLLVDPDPILGFDFGFVNTTEEEQIFNIVVSLPVTPFGGATVIGGSIGGSVTDQNEDGYAMIGTVGTTPIFDGTIDGATWLTLYDAPYQVEMFETGATLELGPDADGLPGPTKPGPVGVADLLSVELTFRLSAGDFANFNGIFIVEYVPAPAGALVLAFLPALRRRRR